MRKSTLARVLHVTKLYSSTNVYAEDAICTLFKEDVLLLLEDFTLSMYVKVLAKGCVGYVLYSAIAPIEYQTGV